MEKIKYARVAYNTSLSLRRRDVEEGFNGSSE
jgi:hypothetical protein